MGKSSQLLCHMHPLKNWFIPSRDSHGEMLNKKAVEEPGRYEVSFGREI